MAGFFLPAPHPSSCFPWRHSQTYATTLLIYLSKKFNSINIIRKMIMIVIY